MPRGTAACMRAGRRPASCAVAEEGRRKKEVVSKGLWRTKVDEAAAEEELLLLNCT